MRVLRGFSGLWRGCALMLTGMLLGSILTSISLDPTKSLVVRESTPRLRECVQSVKTTEYKTLRASPNITHQRPPPPHSITPKHLSNEYALKNMLTVAVLTNQNHLKMANAIFDTWGDSASQIMFFVGGNCDVTVPMATGLPLVKVPGLDDSQANSVNKTFKVLQYLSENYLHMSHWFMLTTDQVYVRLDKLEGLLKRLDPSSLVYLGHSANGRQGDSDKLLLHAHERYCLGSTGMVVSGGLLNTLSDHLEHCRSGAINTGSGPESTEWPDVELGKCISRTTGTQCSHSTEAHGYFMADYTGNPPTLASMESQRHFNELITYHPANTPTIMQTLHVYYTRVTFKTALDRAHYDQSMSMTACNALGILSTDECTTSFCQCPTESSKCPSVGMVNDPAKSYQPSTIYDYQSWQYFDDRTLYSDKSVIPSIDLKHQKDRRKELQVMLSKAVQVASERFGRRLKFKRLVNGWVRHNPFRGSEYIVDCLFTDGFTRTISKRVSLVRPLASNYVSVKDSIDQQNEVSFVVPLSNVNTRFQEFMQMYESIALETKEKVRLVLAVYGAKDIKFVNSVLQEYRSKYPEAHMTVLEGKGDFSRGKAIHLGMSHLETEDLAFVCDVDMSVSQEFIDRCRKNTLQGKRLYYPEFFKLYNLDYVYKDGGYPNRVALKRQHGHWAYYSFGMLCIYKSDYTMVGGMNTNIVGWGEEDVKFFEKVVRKKLEVLRAPDAGLSHRWHEKTCPKSLSKTQHAHCLSSRGENLADRIELANYIYEHDLQIKYGGHGHPHNVQLSFTNDTDYS